MTSVETPRTVEGFDWGDAGLGASAAIGLALVAAAGILTAVRMRRRPAALR